MTSPKPSRRKPAADGITPTPERIAQGAGDLEQPAAPTGQPRPYRTPPAWRTLAENGWITAEQATICERYATAFAVAKLEKDMKVTSKAKSPPPPERTVSGHGRVASGGTDTTLEKLREEAARTGDMTKVIEYKRKLRDTKRG